MCKGCGWSYCMITRTNPASHITLYEADITAYACIHIALVIVVSQAGSDRIFAPPTSIEISRFISSYSPLLDLDYLATSTKSLQHVRNCILLSSHPESFDHEPKVCAIRLPPLSRFRCLFPSFTGYYHNLTSSWSFTSLTFPIKVSELRREVASLYTSI